MLPAGQRAERGTFEQDKVMARAKLAEAGSLQEARIWLSGKERFIALHDRALIALIARLSERRAAE